jgi:hypothetical protein
MEQELKDKWLAALRSGNYQQTTDSLHKDGAYCCLGVLCTVAGADMSRQQRSFVDYEGEGVVTEPAAWIDEKNYTDDEELGPLLLSRFGIGNKVENALVTMNDTEKRDFTEIADWIEKHDLRSGNIIT